MRTSLKREARVTFFLIVAGFWVFGTDLFSAPLPEPSKKKGVEKLFSELPYGLTFGISHDSARSLLDSALGLYLFSDTTLEKASRLQYDYARYFTFESHDVLLGFRPKLGLFYFKSLYGATEALSTFEVWEALDDILRSYLGEPQAGKESRSLLNSFREWKSENEILDLVINNEAAFFSSWDATYQGSPFQIMLSVDDNGYVKISYINKSGL